MELARGAYERGEWAGAVAEAWERGKHGKMEKRKRGDGVGTVKADTAELAKTVVSWIEDWWKGQGNE